MRPVHFIASCLRDLRRLPPDVRTDFGFAIYEAQKGEKALSAVPMVGFGSAKVLEILSDHDGETYRAVYTVKFAKAVYVLHAFQKKSKRGIATPLADLSVVKERLKVAEAHYRATYSERSEKDGK